MKIEILDVDRLIAVNKLQEVTSPYIRSNKMMFDPNGLMSNDIFGISKDDRRSTFAYIDLHRHYIHPHIFNKVLKQRMFKGIVFLVAGQKYYSIKNGLLAEDPDNGWTGVDALYEHWDEIDWSQSMSRDSTSKKLLTMLPRDQVFISKQLVCPPAYRDIMLSGSMDSSDYVNQLNDLYQQLIRSVSLLSEGGLFSRTQYATQSKVQNLLVEIMLYFQEQIKGKNGYIRRSLLGKSVDYGVRAVISTPTYNHERIEDNIIDIDHSAVPISMCCSLFYPFIEAWLRDFFTREVINDPNLATYYDEETNKEFTAVLKDPEIQFSERNIKKMVDDYCLNPDNRFRTITVDVQIPQKNGVKTKKAVMILKGKKILPNNIAETLHRAMTVTDILYLACVDVCEKRHIMVSRYPVGTDKGIYFNKLRVQSTIKHVKLIFNGKEYPYYPDIDFKIDKDMVGVQYVDTLVLSNSHCQGMGADYDGDVLSIRGIYTDEANMEADQIMNQKISALNITGANSKVVSKEVFNTMYELTKNGKSVGKKVADTDREHLLKMQPNDITLSYLISLFADTVDDSTKNVAGKHKSRYDTWDTMTVPAGYFYKGQPEIHTTIGRFVANKFMFQGAGIIEGMGYFNDVINGKSLSKIDDAVATLYLEDHINRQQFNSYLDHRDTIGYWLNGVLAHTISAKMAKPLPEIEKKKAELCTKYQAEIAAGNIDVMTHISDELVAYAKELLKDDPGMDLYDSGDLNFGNNYKNNSILKGAVYNKLRDEFDFVDTSFMDGIDVKDIPAHANSILASQYPASVATRDSGYASKKILALLQMMEIDEPGTDCGTKNLIPITITNVNKNDMLYTYIQDGSEEVMLTRDNIAKYVGKKVMMRSPMSCINDKICSKCAGQLFYLLGVKHAGLFGTQVSHTALNLGLKAKHDSVITLFTLDPDKVVEDL